MKNHLYTTLLFLLSWSALLAQTGALEGVISDNTGPLPGANILIKDSKYFTTTDLDGYFHFYKIPPGNYQLEVSYMGYQTLEMAIQLTNGETNNIGTLNLESSSELMDVEVEVVSTMKDGEKRAINMTKLSNKVVNIVAAEGIGKLPDRNAAEALQRMPAIALERDQGEGRYVSVRGTPRDWSSSLINGDRMPVADEGGDSRTLSFDIFPSELIEYIIVSKALTPDQEADAIGGSVNFVTRTAPEERSVFAKVGGGYNAQSRGDAYTASLTYGDRLGDGKFGYLVSGSVFNRSWGTDNYEVAYNGSRDHSVARFELRDYTGRRQTVGINASAEYLLNNRSKVYFKGVHGRFDDDELNRKTIFFYRLGTGDQIELQNIHNKMEMRFWGGEVGGNFNPSPRLNLNVKIASYSNSFNYGNVPNRTQLPSDPVERAAWIARGLDIDPSGYFGVRFQLTRPLEFLDMVYSEDGIFKLLGDDQIGFFGSTVDSLPDIKYDFENMRFDTVGWDYFRLLDSSQVTGPGDPYDNIQPQFIEAIRDSNFEFFAAYSQLLEVEEKDPIVVQLDLDYKISNQLNVQFGGKYRMKEGFRENGLIIWNQDILLNSNKLLLPTFDTEPLNTQGGFLNEIGAPYDDRLYSFLTEDALDNFLVDNSDFLRVEDLDTWQEEDVIADLGGDYSYEENVAAAYGMLNFNPTNKWSITAGLRMEHTFLRMQGLSLDTILPIFTDSSNFNQVITSDTIAEQDYFSFFPSVHVRYSPTRNLNLRFSTYRAIRRPNFNELNPGEPSVEFLDFIYEFGNANLEPTYAWNFDLTAEYFFDNSGMIAVGGFYKRVDNHIFATNIPRESSAYDRNNELLRNYDNASEAYVIGAELSFVKKLSFLPGILSGFGVNTNGSIMDSRMTTPGRTNDPPLPRQADYLVNAAIFYEKGKISARLALNYRGSYLAEVNTFQEDFDADRWLHNNTEYDIFMGEFASLDFSGTYLISDQWSVFLDLNNLLNSPYRMYRGKREHPIQTEYYSIRGLAGLKFKL